MQEEAGSVEQPIGENLSEETVIQEQSADSGQEVQNIEEKEKR